MTKINIRESLKHLDEDTFCKYDLTTLYDSCVLDDKDKKLIARLLYDKEDPEVIYQKLCMYFDDDEIADIDEFILDTPTQGKYESIIKKCVDKLSETYKDVKYNDVANQLEFTDGNQQFAIGLCPFTDIDTDDYELFIDYNYDTPCCFNTEQEVLKYILNFIKNKINHLDDSDVQTCDDNMVYTVYDIIEDDNRLTAKCMDESTNDFKDIKLGKIKTEKVIELINNMLNNPDYKVTDAVRQKIAKNSAPWGLAVQMTPAVDVDGTNGLLSTGDFGGEASFGESIETNFEKDDRVTDGDRQGTVLDSDSQKILVEWDYSETDDIEWVDKSAIEIMRDKNLYEFVNEPKSNDDVKNACKIIGIDFNGLEYKNSDAEFSNNDTYTKQGNSNDIAGYETKVRNSGRLIQSSNNNTNYYREYVFKDVLVHFDYSDKGRSKIVLIPYSRMIDSLDKKCVEESKNIIATGKEARKYLDNKVNNTSLEDSKGYWKIQKDLVSGGDLTIVADVDDIPRGYKYRFSFDDINTGTTLNMDAYSDYLNWYIVDDSVNTKLIESNNEDMQDKVKFSYAVIEFVEGGNEDSSKKKRVTNAYKNQTKFTDLDKLGDLIYDADADVKFWSDGYGYDKCYVDVYGEINGELVKYHGIRYDLGDDLSRSEHLSNSDIPEIEDVLTKEYFERKQLGESVSNITLDMWYNDDVKDVDKIDVQFYDNDTTYRGNLYIGNKMVGDYSTKDSVALEKQFPQFNWSKFWNSQDLEESTSNKITDQYGNTYDKETDLYFPNIDTIAQGPTKIYYWDYSDPNACYPDWEEKEVKVDVEISVDTEELIQFFLENADELEQFVDKDGEFDEKSATKYVVDNLDELIEKYEGGLKDYFSTKIDEKAQEEASDYFFESLKPYQKEEFKKQLQDELYDKFIDLAKTPEWGFENLAELGEYLMPTIEVNDYEGEYDNDIEVEFRAEVNYRDLEDVCDTLDKVVRKYDKNAYFEPVQPGIAVAYLKFPKKLKEDYIEDAQDTQLKDNEVILYRSGKINRGNNFSGIWMTDSLSYATTYGDDTKAYKVMINKPLELECNEASCPMDAYDKLHTKPLKFYMDSRDLDSVTYPSYQKMAKEFLELDPQGANRELRYDNKKNRYIYDNSVVWRMLDHYNYEAAKKKGYDAIIYDMRDVKEYCIIDESSIKQTWDIKPSTLKAKQAIDWDRDIQEDFEDDEYKSWLGESESIKEDLKKNLKVYTFSSTEKAPFAHYVRWFVYADSEDSAREMIDTYLSINNEYSFSDFYGGRRITKKEMGQMIDRGVNYIELTPDNFMNKEEFLERLKEDFEDDEIVTGEQEFDSGKLCENFATKISEELIF